MKRLAALACAAGVLAGCGEADPQTSMISVRGEGKVEVPPDQFFIWVELRSEADTRIAALASLNDDLNELRENIHALEGVTEVKISTNNAQSSTVRPSGCGYGRERDVDCSPLAEEATLAISIVAKPAEAAGNAVSLLSELGYYSVEFGGYGVSDPLHYNAAARAEAIEDAKSRAQEIAAGFDAKLGPVLDVRYLADTRATFDRKRDDAGRSPVERSELSLARIQVPTVEIELDPSPIAFTQLIDVTFRIVGDDGA